MNNYILIALTKAGIFVLKYMGEGVSGSKYAWAISYAPIGIVSFKSKQELIEYFQDIQSVVPKTDYLGNRIEKIYIRHLE